MFSARTPKVEFSEKSLSDPITSVKLMDCSRCLIHPKEGSAWRRSEGRRYKQNPRKWYIGVFSRDCAS